MIFDVVVGASWPAAEGQGLRAAYFANLPARSIKKPDEELLEWSEFPPTVFQSYGSTKKDNSRERGVRRARNIAAGGLARAKQFFQPVPAGSIGPLPPLPAPGSEAVRRMKAGLRVSADVAERAVGYECDGDVRRFASLTVEYAKEAHREAQLLGAVTLPPLETWAPTGQAPPSLQRQIDGVFPDVALAAQFNLRPAVVRLQRLGDPGSEDGADGFPLIINSNLLSFSCCGYIYFFFFFFSCAVSVGYISRPNSAHVFDLLRPYLGHASCFSDVLGDQRADGEHGDRPPSPDDVGNGDVEDEDPGEDNDLDGYADDEAALNGGADDDEARDDAVDDEAVLDGEADGHRDEGGNVVDDTDGSDDEGRLVIDEDAAVVSGLRSGARRLSFAAPDDFPPVPRHVSRSSVFNPRASGKRPSSKWENFSRPAWSPILLLSNSS